VAHRAAVYTVRVKRARKRSDKYRSFGDIDEAGTYLGDRLLDYISDAGFEGASADGSKVVRCAEAELDGDDLRAVMLHGQSGVAADIYDSARVFRLHQEADDTHEVRCGVLFQLPRAGELGWLAAHVNNGRSAFGLLKTALEQSFRQGFSDEKLLLEITPFVQGSVLREAIDQDRLDKVRLVKWEQPDDRAVAATSRWVEAGDVGRVEVTYSAPERAKRLASGLVQRYLGGDGSAFSDIVEFQGVTFDEAKVVVELENGTHRTFNIEKPEAGHTLTTDLTDLDYEDGEPTDESVFAALATALAQVSS
jgi:hypothetical protein